MNLLGNYYATFSHLALAIFYLMFNKNIRKININNFYKYFSIITILYLIGHILICKSFYNQSREIDNKNYIYYGACGHFILFMFTFLTFFMYDKNRVFKVIWNNVYEKYNIIFLLGQLGMIYLYYVKYNNSRSRMNNFIHLITFSLLGIFYFTKIKISSDHKENNLIQLGLFLVGVLYLINIVNIYDDIKKLETEKNK